MRVVQVPLAVGEVGTPALETDERLPARTTASQANTRAARTPLATPTQDEPDAALLEAVAQVARARGVREARKLARALRERTAASAAGAAWDALLDSVIARVRECERLQRLAGSDELTAIANRRAFNDALRRELARSAREHRPLALLMFDLDGLKTINDEFGHAAGDQALRVVARCAGAIVRHGDLLARIGGDEFAVVLPNTDAQKARAVGSRIRERLRGVDAGGFAIRLSLGIAVAEGASHNCGALLRAADADLYRDKLARKSLRP